MLISIITPNHNYAQYLEQAIRSVCEQEGVSVEHIVVDDGSTDDSVAVVRGLMTQYPNLVLRTQENRGQTPAINHGLRICRGDVMGWLNSDDYLKPGALHTVAELFESDPGLDVVYGDADVVDPEGRFMYRIRHLQYSYRTGVYCGFNRIVTSNAVFWRRRALERAGLLRDEFVCNMDGEFFSRLFHGSKVRHIAQPLANFRQQPFTMASRKRPDWLSVMNREVAAERIASYARLPESRVLSYGMSYPIRLLTRGWRALRRFAHGHYLKKKLELRRYDHLIYLSKQPAR